MDDAARVPGTSSGGPQRGHHQRPAVRDRERHPVLQRRRRVSRAGHAQRRAGGAQGGSPARRTGRRGPRLRDAPGARTRHAGSPGRTRLGAATARLLHPRRAPLPGPGIRRRQPAATAPRAEVPLTRANCDQETLAEYTSWVLDTLPQVRRAVESLHERGVVFGDLHPSNILISGEGRLVLIDYEVATLSADRARAALGHPAFSAPPGRHGVDIDAYALACLCLGLFAPQLTIMLPLDRTKVVQLAGLITETFPVAPEVIDEAVRTIAGADPMTVRPLPRLGRDGWPQIREAMCRAILASATPEREDRLFPGDVAQFQPGGGVSLAYGAAGVLYALDAAGAPRLPEYEDWLRRRARPRIRERASGSTTGSTAWPTSWTCSDTARTRSTPWICACGRSGTRSNWACSAGSPASG
ncbi:phosphotransferase [Streptosporangium lutulentum]